MRRRARWTGACAAIVATLAPSSLLFSSLVFSSLVFSSLVAAQEPPVFDEKGRPVEKPKAPPPQRKITMPEPLEYVPPVYPEEAKKQRIEGAVVLKLTIDVDGKVLDAQVLEPGGHGFDEAALEAAKKLKFKPARYEDGKPFKAVIKYRYTFELEEAPPPPALPATGVLRGKVLMVGTDAPLAGAELTVTAPDGGKRTVRTNAQGEFNIEDLPPGNYQLTLEAPGHESLTITERVEAGKELVATYRLTERVEAGVIDIVVRGSKPPREVTRRSIERREIDRIPGTKGDAIRSIENLPGVARPPAIAGVLIVRGSAPFDTQTFVDGIYVPIIYHFGGLSSVVPTELLDKIDFYPGNFSSRYGRAMGGIVDVSLRSPRTDGYH
ncbi:MAG TPA: TonB family protein, partial [Polyangiaceae bacterium]|nr:TonB family protein [Polyangiaceae bacterium]